MQNVLARTPKPVIALIVAFLCPTEFSLYLGSLRIPPHRLALMVLLPIALVRLFSQRTHRLRSFDTAIFLFGFWTICVFTLHHGYPDGLINGGSLALDGMGAYLVSRVWIRDLATCQATLRTFAWAIAIAALIALPETLFGQTFTHDALRAITGYVHPTGIETRLGLTRAYGTFDHPIHYGGFCAALLAMFWYSETSTGRRLRRAALLSGATFLGLSSAPLLCLGLQAGMLLWERLTRGIKNRAAITLAIILGLYIGVASVAKHSPIYMLATGLTLDAQTGFYRTLIWDYGIDNVYANLIAGIGMNDWIRPEWMAAATVDNFWLVIAMREGVPAFALIAAAMALMAHGVAKYGLAHQDLKMRRLARGWLMSLIAFFFVGATVHFWNVLYAYFFFFIGFGGWLADPKRMRSAAKAGVRRAYRHSPSAYPTATMPAGDWQPRPQPA